MQKQQSSYYRPIKRVVNRARLKYVNVRLLLLETRLKLEKKREARIRKKLRDSGFFESWKVHLNAKSADFLIKNSNLFGYSKIL